MRQKTQIQEAQRTTTWICNTQTHTHTIQKTKVREQISKALRKKKETLHTKNKDKILSDG